MRHTGTTDAGPAPGQPPTSWDRASRTGTVTGPAVLVIAGPGTANGPWPSTVNSAVHDVVTRLDTYQIDVDAETRAYMNAVLSHPAFVAWRDAALQEPWQIAHYEEGETAVEIFHRPRS